MTDGGRLWASVLRVVEAELGEPLAHSASCDRRRLVALLADAGAFELRYGVALSAELLGVSRYTVYGDLRRLDGEIHRRPAPRPKRTTPTPAPTPTGPLEARMSSKLADARTDARYSRFSSR